MRKNILRASITLLLLGLSACAHKPPDVPICVEMSMDRAECIKIISGEKITIDETHKLNDKTYWEMRPTNLIMPMESWAEIKKWIIKSCKKNEKQCEKSVSSWDRSIENVEEPLKEKIHGPIKDTTDLP